MRQPLRANTRRAATAVARSIPAPVGGWDTESPLAAMPAKNAVILDNWIPRQASCVLRGGYVQQVTGTGAVESLIAWRGDPAGDKLFACAGADIFDVTAQTSLGSSLYGSALSARWHGTNFANDAGAFALAGNGVNTPIAYDGTAWSSLAITTPSTQPVPLDPTTLTRPMTHKRRVWWIEAGTMRSWYLQTNAIQGDASPWDIGPVANKGGHLVAQATWSLDGGVGMDDAAVFLTSEGQVVIYQGIDVTNVDDWSHVGTFDLGRPVGERPMIKWGSDLAVITEDGIVPLSQALSRDRAQDDDVALTARIATAFARAARDYSGNYGWGGILYSGQGSLAIFNIPTEELGTSVQFVQSMQGGKWCRFTGIDAFCWEVANQKAYFGGADGVYRWDAGSSDNGSVISGDVKTAFSAFGYPVAQKRFTMVQPILRAPAIIQPAVEILTDYKEQVPTAVPTVVRAGDVSADDMATTRQNWTAARGMGLVGAARMRVAIQGDDTTSRLSINGSDLILIESGGDHVLISPNLPLDVPVELIGFNILFQPGAPL